MSRQNYDLNYPNQDSNRNLDNNSNINRNVENNPINPHFILSNKFIFLLFGSIFFACTLIDIIILSNINIRKKKNDLDNIENIDNNNKTCNIENCLKCIDQICIECLENYISIYNNQSKNIESCIEKKNCKNGLFIPDNDKKKCIKCSLENCNICSGNLNSDICHSCKKSYIPIYNNETNQIEKCECKVGEEEKCSLCSGNKCIKCNLGFKMVKDSCELYYSFKAIYKTDIDSEPVKLINNNYLKYCEEIIYNGTKLIISDLYTFQKAGNHILYFTFDLKGANTLSNFFYSYGNNINNLISIIFTSSFNTSNIKYMNSMFKEVSKLSSVDISSLDTSKVSEMAGMFYKCTNLISVNMSNLNFSSLQTINSLFQGCISLTNLDFSLFNAKKLNYIKNVFTDCQKLTSFDFSNHKFEGYSLDSIFKNCYSLKYVNFTNFSTDKVTSMLNAFQNCYSLTSIDLSSFRTDKINTLGYMFDNCRSLTSLDLSYFFLSGSESKYHMLYNCTNLTYLNIRNFRIKSETSMFEKLPNSGTIIVYDDPNMISNYIRKYLPNWTINPS